MDTTVQDPLVGRLLDDRYEVGPRLAHGGMATVYQGLDTRLDRTVALKVMHPALAADPDFVARFIREAKSAARLSHPGVVSVYDQGNDNGVVFLAMEYVEGHTLRDLLRQRGGRLAPREALDLLEPVLAALGAAHRAGIVHRDIKPENVLLGDDGRVKVADFGLARAISSATAVTTTSGVFIGTVAYLAPEQVERGVSDPRSDVYAAGILLFEMLTGQKPFAGDNVFHVMNQRVYDEVPPPSRLVPGLAPGLDRLVGLATARDPDLRPSDADQFLAELVRTRASLSPDELDGAALPPPEEGTSPTLIVSAGGLPYADPPPYAGQSPTAALPVSPPADLPYAAALPVSPPAAPPPTDPPPAAAPPPTPRRRRRRGLVALLLVLLLAAGLSGAAWWVGVGPGAYTTTPSVLGLTRGQAESKLSAAGLTVRYAPAKYSETVPAGHVMTSNPRPNGQVRNGAAVTLTLSRGKERYAVPGLGGLTRDQAKQALTAGHLSLGEVTARYDAGTPAGQVIAQQPDPQASVKAGTAVSIVLSQGPPPVNVPDVTGQDLGKAEKQLSDVGLRSSVAGEEFSDTVNKGQVLRQDPASGTALQGSTVALVVSKGPDLVEVPNVIGDRTDKATVQLVAAGFKVTIVRAPFGPGKVYDQSPTGKVKRGSTITLYVV